MILGERSLQRLEGVHPALVSVVKCAMRHATEAGMDFTVLEGLRTLARQKKLLEQGATKTLNSRHLTGHAVDLGVLIAGKVDWHWELYERLALIVKNAATEMGVVVEWGGSWPKFRDGPHHQLPWKDYPSTGG